MDLYEGFKPIAVRDDRHGRCVISYHPDKKLYLLVIDNKPAGPFTLRELEALDANVKDVLDLKGRYIYIDSYTAEGEKK